MKRNTEKYLKRKFAGKKFSKKAIAKIIEKLFSMRSFIYFFYSIF